MTKFDIYVALGHQLDTRWAIVARHREQSTCTVYTTEYLRMVQHYDHVVYNQEPFPPQRPSFPEMYFVASIPENRLLEFENGCVYATFHGPSQHYAVRVLYGMLGKEYMEMVDGCVPHLRSLAKYQAWEKNILGGLFVLKDSQFYAEVDR